MRQPGANEEQDGHHAPPGPRDGDERGQDTAGAVVPAPGEVAPIVLQWGVRWFNVAHGERQAVGEGKEGKGEGEK